MIQSEPSGYELSLGILVITILRNRKIRGITRYHTIKKEIPIYTENEESPPVISFIRIIDTTIANTA
jgi:hypothetical protein|tara:strand:- start:1072 stop:1272 length:201 start_codon:yes stop_codon:yes gene_type:complete